VSCSHSNPSFTKFCTTCGEKLDVLECRCGAVSASNAIFCYACGQNLQLNSSNNLRQADSANKISLKAFISQVLSEEAPQQLKQRIDTNIQQDDIDDMFSTDEDL